MRRTETVRRGKRFISFSYDENHWVRYKLWLVSKHGQVKSILTNRVLVQTYNSKGYLRVKVDGKNWLVHRLVMLVWSGPSELQVDHGDGVKDNNEWCNLQYVTGVENVARARKRKKWSAPSTDGAPF